MSHGLTKAKTSHLFIELLYIYTVILKEMVIKIKERYREIKAEIEGELKKVWGIEAEILGEINRECHNYLTFKIILG